MYYKQHMDWGNPRVKSESESKLSIIELFKINFDSFLDQANTRYNRLAVISSNSNTNNHSIVDDVVDDESGDTDTTNGVSNNGIQNQ